MNTNSDDDEDDDDNDKNGDGDDVDGEEYFRKNDFACKAHLSFHYSEETVN